MAVTGLVYSPAEWVEKEEEKAVAGKPVNLAEVQSLATADPTAPFYVGDPWYVQATVEALTEANTKHYEGLAVAELNEPGIWRIVVTSSAPLKDVVPDLITVQPTAEL